MSIKRHQKKTGIRIGRSFCFSRFFLHKKEANLPWWIECRGRESDL